MKVRRVVTGHDEHGNAVFTADDELDASGLVGACLWAYDEPPTFPNDGSTPGGHTYYPPVGGARFHIGRLNAGVNASGDTTTNTQEFFSANPHLGLGQKEADAAGFHTDDCITFHIVLEGSVTLELGEGQRRLLHAGDVLVQNGTQHRWIGSDDGPSTIAFVMIGATRDAVPDEEQA
jgi:hypothetical protein